jgi:pimeloyl-ACP methyl ester carboxylesterase
VGDVVVNGVRLHHEERGEGAPILCVHGGGSSALLWEDALPPLARLGRVIAYDRRGCSRSERPEPYARTTVAEQADDAAALLEALEAGPAVVIGRSYGGAVAVDLALRHPTRVCALVLLEGDALGLVPAAWEWTRALRDRLVRVRAEEGIDAVFAALIAEVAGPGAWATFPEGLRAMLTANGEALLAELAYVDHAHPGEEEFAGLALPVLVVAARESPPELRAMSERMAACLPRARLALVDGGHLIDPAGPEVLAFVAGALRA